MDLKENEKTQAEWVLSEAIGQMRKEESKLSELQQSKTDIQEQLHEASGRRTTVSNLMLLQSYVDHIEGRIQAKHRDVQQARGVVQLRQDDLNGKMLEEKVWNKAKEKAYQRFTADLLKREQDQLDEMATNRYKRLS